MTNGTCVRASSATETSLITGPTSQRQKCLQAFSGRFWALAQTLRVFTVGDCHRPTAKARESFGVRWLDCVQIRIPYRLPIPVDWSEAGNSLARRSGPFRVGVPNLHRVHNVNLISHQRGCHRSSRCMAEGAKNPFLPWRESPKREDRAPVKSRPATTWKETLPKRACAQKRKSPVYTTKSRLAQRSRARRLSATASKATGAIETRNYAEDF